MQTTNNTHRAGDNAGVNHQQHTPGPWHLRVNHELDLAVEVRAGDKTQTQSDVICTMESSTDVNVTKANGRLIAAAPELLEACERMLGFITHRLPASAWQAEPWLQPARAVLAKAGGAQ